VRRHAKGLVEPGDTVGEHAGLAGTGAGEHEIVARRCADGLALGGVQRVEQMRNIHATHSTGHGVSQAEKARLHACAGTVWPSFPGTWIRPWLDRFLRCDLPSRA